MRERKFLAGLATIFIFAGVFCLRAAFAKIQPVTGATKIYLLLGGVVCIGAGMFLFLKAFNYHFPLAGD